MKIVEILQLELSACVTVEEDGVLRSLVLTYPELIDLLATNDPESRNDE